MRKLPDTYAELQSLLDEMPVVKDDGSPGLLATERALEQATERLPNFLNKVKRKKIQGSKLHYLGATAFWHQPTPYPLDRKSVV